MLFKFVVDNGGDVAGGGGKTLHFSKKDCSIAICVVQVSSRAKPPLLECMFTSTVVSSTALTKGPWRLQPHHCDQLLSHTTAT